MCVCPGERRLRYVIHDQDLAKVDWLCSLIHLVFLLIYVRFVFSSPIYSFLRIVSFGADQVLHKSNIISTNLTIPSE